MFITLEGPDGSGKTQQIHLLADFLTEKGYKVFFSREPGGTEIGDQIRTILMDLKNTKMNPRTETLLFCASRAQIVEEVIKPKLKKGYIVILDRYADSTLAYQGYGHGNDLQTLRTLLDFATAGLKPDLTILLDLDPELGLNRRKKGGGEWNRMDAYRLELHKRVREGYREMASREPQRWRIISADQPIEVVQSELRNLILDYLE
ncbi:MAG: dTMP kinase [Chloroflexi bacterium]|nr:dTMP kinase [Chloroflexota bacterium]